jgi:hypothetical protein
MLLTRQRLDLVGGARMPSGGSERFADAPGVFTVRCPARYLFERGAQVSSGHSTIGPVPTKQATCVSLRPRLPLSACSS